MKLESFVVGMLKLFSSKDIMRKPYCLCKTNKQEKISKHESSSKSVKVVANIHVGLQFCGKAALKRHITSYKYQASEASEGEVHFVPFSPKILIVWLIVKFYKPFSQ